MNCESCGQEIPRQYSGLGQPVDSNLPFLAYGVFKPGELAFLQIKEFVIGCSLLPVDGHLKMRDGLPIAILDSAGVFDGVLIRFVQDSGTEFYKRIAALEPEKQYRWKAHSIDQKKVNILVGLNPTKGTHEMDVAWDGTKDPLFTSALEVVDEALSNTVPIEMHDLRPLFRLEAAYMLLWSSIERYASLRYHFRANATKKVERIALEPAFSDALHAYVKECRSVYRADKPKERLDLDPNNPDGSLRYYYQIRHNLVHRGKGAFDDYDRLKKSLQELLAIYRTTLAAAFEESKYPVQ